MQKRCHLKCKLIMHKKLDCYVLVYRRLVFYLKEETNDPEESSARRRSINKKKIKESNRNREHDIAVKR